MLRELIVPTGLTPTRLRVDRILDEARHTADPLHLMHLFAISAVAHTRATHPEHFATDPTRA
ncbi:hypothetical protein OG895_39455 [Streptomyces sp. NBC_00201]|uniref:hypothetical protein n=1 Tax=unclassified Streptomyces TaxID=2593676 RepID=UPI0022589DD8|nr:MULTISPECIES: hypothetical protein [unclassified Streptomyces]MCX5063348.1 hypothetical protein [Streptomyces sp. NBC_00452]MCX5251201.1 hypothetical protein [Streptomyces sp. NBC_00201]MCX5290870.1 hypothetical protein [Streptomyces sp. NBC_00183]